MSKSILVVYRSPESGPDAKWVKAGEYPESEVPRIIDDLKLRGYEARRDDEPSAQAIAEEAERARHRRIVADGETHSEYLARLAREEQERRVANFNKAQGRTR